MLLFNNEYTTNYSKNNSISIHLMLLFNAILTPFLVRLPYFNTSNVTIQHFSIEIKLISIFISIHLMLLFNYCIISKCSEIPFISIHLMLLFNYRSRYKGYGKVWISIHLMLLFNALRAGIVLQHKPFQYI